MELLQGMSHSEIFKHISTNKLTEQIMVPTGRLGDHKRSHLNRVCEDYHLQGNLVILLIA